MVIQKTNNLQKEKYLYDSLQNEIANKIGFSKNKINLQISKRYDRKSKTIDYNEFIYEGKQYLLIKNTLKIIEKNNV